MTERVPLASSSTTVPVVVSEPISSSSSWCRKLYDRLSQSRQIFCLFCIFDFLFTFFLWIIYAQGVSVSGLDDSLSSEIEHYGITSSLFDIALISMVRSCILLVVYGYYIYGKAYIVVITTGASTIYLIVKAFVFEFEEKEVVGNRPVDYILHIASFLLCWAEAWYFLVKVLPREKREALLRDAVLPNYGTIPNADPAYSVLSFYTPQERDSGDDEEVTREKLKYIETARRTTSKALHFLYAEKQWNKEREKGNIFIESTTDEIIGKVVKVWVIIDACPQIVYPLIYGDFENLKSWNVSLKEMEVIYTVNSTTDIIYSSTGDVAGGLISGRDYVSLRHFQRVGSMFLSTTTTITSDLKPPVHGVVRGIVPLNCYALCPVEDDPNKSEFTWITSTTLKPSMMIPQRIVDHGVPGFLIECVENLKKSCEKMKSNGNTAL